MGLGQSTAVESWVLKPFMAEDLKAFRRILSLPRAKSHRAYSTRAVRNSFHSTPHRPFAHDIMASEKSSYCDHCSAELSAVPGYHLANDSCFWGQTTHSAGRSDCPSVVRHCQRAVSRGCNDFFALASSGSDGPDTPASQSSDVGSTAFGVPPEAGETEGPSAGEAAIGATPRWTCRVDTNPHEPAKSSATREMLSESIASLHKLRDAELKSKDEEYRALEEKLRGDWARAELDGMIGSKYAAVETGLITAVGAELPVSRS